MNAATGASWQLESQFDTGALGGAWRVRDGSQAAVLKWHAPDPSAPAAYNPHAPAVVEFVRAQGYPTPRWLGAGVTTEGVAWSVQELVEGEPLRRLDAAAAGIFIDLVRLHRTLAPPTTMNWNQYIRAHAFGTYDRLPAAEGDHVRRLVDEALDLAAPYESVDLQEDEMVHADLNVSNVLVRDGRLVAVVDVDATGRGCAVYDLLSPAINGVSWGSDPQAIERLVRYGLETYEPGSFAIAAACLTIEAVRWYGMTTPSDFAQRVARHRAWLAGIRPRLS